jgi:hypothetical protein
VEWFDFMGFLSLAPVLAKVFFTAGSRSSQPKVTLTEAKRPSEAMDVPRDGWRPRATNCRNFARSE